MLKIFFCFVITLGGACANGEFVVLHSPESVFFHGNEEIDQSLLKEVFAAVLGFTVKQRETWKGISITSPFTLPEAVVSIAVEGVDTLDMPNGKKFRLNDDEVEETTWQAISGRLSERDNDNTLVRIYLGDGLDALGQSALGELKPVPIDESSLKALSLKNEEDRKFLEEIQLLRAIAKKVPTAIKADNKPDVYWLVVSGLHPVFDLHGNNSAAAKEALFLLNNAFNVISEAFMKAYDSKVVITAFTNDASQVRHTRSVSSDRQRRDTKNTQDNKNKNIESMVESSNAEFNSNKIMEKQADQEEENKKIREEENTDTNYHSSSEINSDVSSTTEYIDTNADSGSTEKSDQDLTKTDNKLINNTRVHQGVPRKTVGQNKWKQAKTYTHNYPVMFNIFLWFGVVFIFSLLAICIAIADMDPGRDSIIYRMTSNRMKKDN